MNKTLEKIMARLPILWIAITLIGVIIGLIFGVESGVFTFMGIAILIILFVFMRQLWWYITSTGDYEKTNTKKY